MHALKQRLPNGLGMGHDVTILGSPARSGFAQRWYDIRHLSRAMSTSQRNFSTFNFQSLRAESASQPQSENFAWARLWQELALVCSFVQPQ